MAKAPTPKLVRQKQDSRPDAARRTRAGGSGTDGAVAELATVLPLPSEFPKCVRQML
jgi:hypothetical protein